MKDEEKMSYEDLAIDADRMRTARDDLMLSNASLKAENYELKQALEKQKPWVGLTDEEAQWLYDNCRTPSNLIDMVEARLKEKNHG
jgi:hypothetical protein